MNARVKHWQFCVCDDCTLKKAAAHREADLVTGRKTWACQCGTCKRARAIKPRAPGEVRS